MAARKLKEEQKVFVVMQLARMRTPSQVVDALREEYGVQIAPSSVLTYDPTTRTGRELSAELRDLFYEERRAFKRKLSEQPMYHQAYRLAELHRQYVRADRAGNTVEARAALEQAAKEVGGLYTNRRTLEVKGLQTAREALGVLLDEFAVQLERGEITRGQLVEIVAEDHGVEPGELAAAAAAETVSEANN
jgi:hypothetical protein